MAKVITFHYILTHLLLFLSCEYYAISYSIFNFKFGGVDIEYYHDYFPCMIYYI